MGKLKRIKELLKRGIEKDENNAVSSNEKNEILSWLGPTELTPERERELLNRLVFNIKKWKLEIPALFTLEIFAPVSRPFSQVYGFFLAPFIELAGISGFDYTLFLGKRENIKKLMEKIRE